MVSFTEREFSDIIEVFKNFNLSNSLEEIYLSNFNCIPGQLISLKIQISNLRKLRIDNMNKKVGKILSNQIFDFLQEHP